MKHPNQIKLNPHPSIRGAWVTQEPLRFWWYPQKVGMYVDIPKGTITNGASVPAALRWLWRMLPDTTRWAWLTAFIMHDRMVGEFGQSRPRIMSDHIYTADSMGPVVIVTRPNRRYAAKWMRRAMECSGEGGALVEVVYQLVRLWDRFKGMFV